MPQTLADFLCLGLLHDGTAKGWASWLSGLEGGLPESGIPPSLDGTTFEDFNLLRAAALSGQGAALCPEAMIQPDLDSGGLVRLSPRPQDDGYNYHLLLSTTAPLPIRRQAEVFRDWTMAERGRA